MSLEKLLVDEFGWDRELLFRAVTSITLTAVRFSFKDGSRLHCIRFAAEGEPTETFKISQHMMRCLNDHEFRLDLRTNYFLKMLEKDGFLHDTQTPTLDALNNTLDEEGNVVVRSNKLHLLRKDDVAKVDSVPLKIRSDDENIILSNNANYFLEPSSDTDSHDEAQTESRYISSASTTSVPEQSTNIHEEVRTEVRNVIPENVKKEILLVMLEENKLAKVINLLLDWSYHTSALKTYLHQRLSTLRRIREDRRIGNKSYILSFIPRYGVLQFQEHFRMAPATFEDLVTEFGGYMDSPGTRKEFNELPVKVKLLMTVWWLANQETFRQVADRFGTTRGNAHYVIMTTCQVIANRLTDFVIWPKKEELSDISAGFDFPNVIGIIDTTPIEIKQPLQQLAAYTNFKSKTVVKVQAVCDSKSRFLDVSIGWPGSLHDSRIYELSSLSGVIDRKLQGTPYYLLGDKGYPLRTRLMTPYRNNGRLNEEQKNFNREMKAQRSLIERAYHVLKGKDRKLHFLDVTNLKYIPSIIGAAVVLHNFTLEVEGFHDEDDLSPLHPRTFGNTEWEDFDELDPRTIRNRIANML